MPVWHWVSKDRTATKFNEKLPPVVTADRGDIVTFETDDSGHERRWKGEQVDVETINAVTGLVFVR